MNGILFHRFKPVNWSSHVWTITLREEPVTKYRQKGYSYDFKIDNPDMFVPASEQSLLPIVAPEEQYQIFIRHDQGFNIPSNFEETLDSFFSLNYSKKQDFWRALTWIEQADKVRFSSSSSYYVNLVTAIESLLDKSGELCPCCGQKKFAIGKKYNDFLEKYIPNINDFSSVKKVIYSTRSELSHGMKLFVRDIEPWHFGTKLGWDEMELELTALSPLAELALFAQ